MPAEMTAENPRSAYQGLREVLLFNWPIYASAAVISALVLWAMRWCRLPGLISEVLSGLTICCVFWGLSSLLVAHYVYDRTGLYKFEWLAQYLPIAPRHWVNIHAGFDDTTEALRRALVGSEGEALDIFDPSEMTAPSIRRARQLAGAALPAPKAKLDELPAPDGSQDAIFLIFTAHEIRRAGARRRFLGELRRVLRPAGWLVIVEHARDVWNFLAFGPGFLHFQWRAEWHRVAEASGFGLVLAGSITPFVRVWVFGRAR